MTTEASRTETDSPAPLFPSMTGNITGLRPRAFSVNAHPQMPTARDSSHTLPDLTALAELCEQIAALERLDDAGALLQERLPGILHIARSWISLPAAPIRLAASASVMKFSLTSGHRVFGTLMIETLSGARTLLPGTDAAARLVVAALVQLALRSVPLGDERSPVRTRIGPALLSQVAHEVKTPLTCIKGHAQLLKRFARTQRDGSTKKLKRGTAARLMEACERHITELEDQVTRIETTLRDMMDVAHSEDESLTLVLGRHNLAALVQRAVSTAELPEAPAIIYDYDLPRDVWVTCDGPRVERALHDLLAHTAHWTDEESLCVTIRGGVWDGEQGVLIRIGGHTHGLVALTEGEQLQPGSAAMPDSVAGLGVLLAAEVARRHGGFLRRTRDMHGTTSFVLMLPEEPTNIA